MNFRNIIEKTKEKLSAAYGFIKSVYRLPDSGKYLIAALLLIIVFTIFTFPFEQLVLKIIHDNQGKAFNTISLMELDVALIGNSYFEKAEISLSDSASVSIDKGTIDLPINPFSLWVRNRISTDFNFGSVRYTGKSINYQGGIGGEADLALNDKSGVPENGSITLKFSSAVVNIGTINIPTSMGDFPLEIGAVKISNLLVETDILNRVMRIKKFVLKSDDLSLNITGSITIEPGYKNSKPDIIVTIDPASEIFSSQRDLITAYTKNSPLEITVKGTLSRPDIKTVKAGTEKNEN